VVHDGINWEVFLLAFSLPCFIPYSCISLTRSFIHPSEAKSTLQYLSSNQINLALDQSINQSINQSPITYPSPPTTTKRPISYHTKKHKTLFSSNCTKLLNHQKTKLKLTTPRMLMTPQLLYRTGADAAEHEPLPKLREAGRSVGECPVIPGGVRPAGPENFGGSTGARPDDAVNVNGVSLLGPGVHFAAQN